MASIRPSGLVSILREADDGSLETAMQLFEEMEEKEPNLEEFEKPKARPANEPDGFVLFDSKRGDLSQIDAYHEWQRR